MPGRKKSRGSMGGGGDDVFDFAGFASPVKPKMKIADLRKAAVERIGKMSQTEVEDFLDLNETRRNDAEVTKVQNHIEARVKVIVKTAFNKKNLILTANMAPYLDNCIDAMNNVDLTKAKSLKDINKELDKLAKVFNAKVIVRKIKLSPLVNDARYKTTIERLIGELAADAVRYCTELSDFEAYVRDMILLVEGGVAFLGGDFRKAMDKFDEVDAEVPERIYDFARVMTSRWD